MGVSHNDFKPENFIVDKQLKVWLIDLEKARVCGKADRQRQRQILDVQNFLHIRGWHRRAEARAIFAAAFLQTPYRNWLSAAGVDRVAAGFGLNDSECDPELSVLIACDGGMKMPLVMPAIDSVQDIADEVVLVEPTDGGRLDVLKRIDVCARAKQAPILKKSTAVSAALPLVRFNWVLTLRQNECVTPFLAKELQQRIADGKGDSTLRIPIEQQYFGRSIARPGGDPPIRLFRRSECSFAISGGSIKVTGSDGNVGRLTGTIRANECGAVSEFVDRLNEESDGAAIRRLNAGERPRLIRAGWKAASQFVAACLRSSGIRSGWTGLQISALEAAFTWVEETKLYQLAGEFRSGNSCGDAQFALDAKTSDEHISSASPRAKAA